MRHLRLKIKGIKPISVNDAYYKSRMIYNRKARAYITEFLTQLLKYKKDMQKFTKAFDPMTECLKVNMSVFMPESEMYTKAGYVSHRSSDVDNMNKVTIDCLFNQKQIQKVVKEFPISNICIDDKFIYDLQTAKFGYDQPSYLIVIDIKIECNQSAHEWGQKILKSVTI